MDDEVVLSVEDHKQRIYVQGYGDVLYKSHHTN